MKTTKRNVALAIIALFSGQLLISCSGTKMQWSKNEVQNEVFASSQFNNKAVAEKTPVLTKELNFNAQPETEAVVLASVGNEIPVAAKKQSPVVNKIDVPQEISKVEKKSISLKNLFNNPTAPKAPEASGKSQMVALLCCIGLIFSIQRFYLGYIGNGILRILLLVVPFVGWITVLVWGIIDAVRIYQNTLKPKGGEYSELIKK